MNPSFRLGVILVLTLLAALPALARPRLHILPALRGGIVSEPMDISANGRVVVGTATTKNGTYQAFRQAGAGGPKKISMSIPVESGAVAVSADGSVALGYTHNAAGLYRVFRWTKETGPVDLSGDPDLFLDAGGLSGNGRVAVGTYTVRDNFQQPFYWTAETGIQSLSVSSFDEGYPYAVSHDGNVIVGLLAVRFQGSLSFPCRWVRAGEPELLEPFGRQGYATRVTPGGSLIVGIVKGTNDVFLPFRWSRAGGMEMLPTDSSYREVYVGDLSADGQRLVGYAATTDGFIPLLWTPETGQQDLNVTFRAVLPRGWRFAWATAISADGRWIVGNLVHALGKSRGYILDTGRPRPFGE